METATNQAPPGSLGSIMDAMAQTNVKLMGTALLETNVNETLGEDNQAIATNIKALGNKARTSEGTINKIAIPAAVLGPLLTTLTSVGVSSGDFNFKSTMGYVAAGTQMADAATNGVMSHVQGNYGKSQGEMSMNVALLKAKTSQGANASGGAETLRKESADLASAEYVLIRKDGSAKNN